MAIKLIYAELRRFVKGSAMITPTELAAFLGLKNVSRVKAQYMDGLEHINGRYFIADVAKRLQQEVRK